MLILDFWATWCSSCLYSLPRLEDLRKRYGGQLQVLMVNAATTGDDEGEIAAFFERRRKKDSSRYTLPASMNLWQEKQLAEGADVSKAALQAQQLSTQRGQQASRYRQVVCITSILYRDIEFQEDRPGNLR